MLATGSMSRFGGRLLALGALPGFLALGCGGSENAETYLKDGAEFFQEGDYDQAIVSYELALEIEPGSAVGYNYLGMAYRMKYNTVRSTDWKEKEIEAFRAAVSADSTYWPAHINLGATLYYLGSKTEAAPHFRRALELHPENPEREQLEAFIREGEG